MAVALSDARPEVQAVDLRMLAIEARVPLAHAQIHGVNFRPRIRERYRQWLMHKLAGWIEQFDTSGCVGCGRCISWCPVGIDLIEEVDAIRREPK